MEFCYALNFSKFSKVFKEDVDIPKFIFENVPMNKKGEKYLFYASASNVFKQSFIESLPIEMVTCHYFYKPTDGGIHVDQPEYSAVNSKNMWGINWNFGSPGIYEFWEYADMSSITTFVNEQGRPHPVMKTNMLPRKRYKHTEGPVLFNAAIPHRAKLIHSNPRFAVSLRMSSPVISWLDAILKFNEYFVNDDKILESI